MMQLDLTMATPATAVPMSFSDVDMLEFVMGPARKARPCAEALIHTFGNFAEVVAAPEHRLAEHGVRVDAARRLKMFHAAAVRMQAREIQKRPVMTNWNAVQDYCMAAFARLDHEEFHVLFLDRKNNLIADELMGKGTIDHAPVYPREILKRALQLDASAIILVHNHPSGDQTPPRADIDMTREIVQACNALKITVHDHLIAARAGCASLKALGAM
jgi:DNA repair protein RadC